MKKDLAFWSLPMLGRIIQRLNGLLNIKMFARTSLGM
jgi:hypothetical protein